MSGRARPPQAQFSGYIAAEQLGYFADECIVISIRPGGPGISVEAEVVEGRSQFGVTWGAIMALSLDNYNVTNVAQIYTRGGMTSLSRKSARINRATDWAGKRIGYWGGGNEGPVLATLAKHQLEHCWEDGNDGPECDENSSPQAVRLIAQQFNMDGFLENAIDGASAMTYNEMAQVLQEINPATGRLWSLDDLSTLDYNKEETQMLEDGLVVSTEWLRQPGNDELTVRFLRACIRGWAWVRDNPSEATQLFVNKGVHQRWQVLETNRLVWPSPLGVGVVPVELQQRTLDIAFSTGLTSLQLNASDVFRSDLAQAALDSLAVSHPDLDVVASDYEGERLRFCLSTSRNVELCPLVQTTRDAFVPPDSAFGIVAIILSVLVLVMTLLLHCFVHVNRNHPVLLRASPIFLHFLLAGVYFAIGSIFAGLVPANDVTCNLRTWLLSLGFTITFSNLFAKNYRIHKIFNNPRLRKIYLKDEVLLSYTSFVILVDVALLVLMALLAPFRAVATDNPNDPRQLDVRCLSPEGRTYTTLLIAYKGGMLLYGCYISLRTKDVGRKFSESKNIASAIYNLTLVLSIALPVLFSVSDVELSMFVGFMATIVSVIAVLVNLFIPKISQLRGDKRTSSRNGRSSSGGAGAASSRVLSGSGGTSRGDALEMSSIDAKTMDPESMSLPELRQAKVRLDEMLTLVSRAIRRKERAVKASRTPSKKSSSRKAGHVRAAAEGDDYEVDDEENDEEEEEENADDERVGSDASLPGEALFDGESDAVSVV
eukprot:PLAT5027.2.p1 GENE.PLAT5027.2~~PLAT5027.2.p1  ORF type:complete len:795 (-),score=419.36 PLAT5027.2:1022-3331(-)